MRWWLLLLLAGCGPTEVDTQGLAASDAGPVQAFSVSQTHDWLMDGETLVGQFGWAVDSAGDVNGDGFDDVIIGAKQYDPAEVEGRAYVFHGSADGIEEEAAWFLDLNTADTWTGGGVAGIGDFNGDGFDDIVVGSPHWDDGADVDAGRVDVYFGSDTGLGLTEAFFLEGDNAGANDGAAVAGAGDVNGDGLADFLVGAPLQDTNNGVDSGAAMLVFGRETTTPSA